MKIYKISNSINSKIYIGKTIHDIETRLQEHFYAATSYNKKENAISNKLYNALLKHGFDNFKTEEIETVQTLDELNKKEVYWIEQFDSYNSGYNGTYGGDGGFNAAANEINSIPVVCLNTGKKYKSGRQAAEDLKILQTDMSAVCRGKKTSIHGYVFEYDNLHTYSDDILNYRALRSKIKEQKHNKILDIETNILYSSPVEASKAVGCTSSKIKYHCLDSIAQSPQRFRNNNVNKSLIIGDWHCKISNLQDSEKLMQWIIMTIENNQIDSVFFMGDQFDTHGIVRLEILCFWTNWLKRLSVLCPIYLIVGNHDMNGNHEIKANEINSLMSFKPIIQNKSDVFYNIHIIDKPTDVEGIAIMPYYYDRELFVKDINDLYVNNNCKNLILAHQNFTQELFGDLINPELIPQTQIISGHVHSNKLSKDKVFYSGTPMWHTSIDSDEEKGIWMIEFNPDKTIKTNTFLPTKEVVTPMYRIIIKEGEEIPELPANAKIAYELIGQSTWIATMKKKLKGKGSIKAVPMDRKHVKADTSKLLNLDEYATVNFKPLVGVTIEDITGYIRRIDGVQ